MGGDDLRRETSEDVALAGIGCMAYLLSSPLVWVHYFVLAIPLALWLLRPRAGASLRIAGGLAAAVATAIVLLANRPLEAIIGQGHPAWVAATSNSGALLLLGAAMIELGRFRSAPRA